MVMDLRVKKIRRKVNVEIHDLNKKQKDILCRQFGRFLYEFKTVLPQKIRMVNSL